MGRCIVSDFGQLYGFVAEIEGYLRARYGYHKTTNKRGLLDDDIADCVQGAIVWAWNNRDKLRKKEHRKAQVYDKATSLAKDILKSSWHKTEKTFNPVAGGLEGFNVNPETGESTLEYVNPDTGQEVYKNDPVGKDSVDSELEARSEAKRRYDGEYLPGQYLLDLILALPEKERRLIQMSVVGGQSLATIAKKWGVSKATAGRWVDHAKQLMWILS